MTLKFRGWVLKGAATLMAVSLAALIVIVVWVALMAGSASNRALVVPFGAAAIVGMCIAGVVAAADLSLNTKITIRARKMLWRSFWSQGPFAALRYLWREGFGGLQ